MALPEPQATYRELFEREIASYARQLTDIDVRKLKGNKRQSYRYVLLTLSRDAVLLYGMMEEDGIPEDDRILLQVKDFIGENLRRTAEFSNGW